MCQDFYERCGELLENPHAFIDRHTRVTRWNNRDPGNGRYPGLGQIRMFGPNCIHVMLRNPIRINRTFDSMDAVFDLLRTFSE